MSKLLFIDIETYNGKRDISVGVYAYAETVEILLIGYAYQVDGKIVASGVEEYCDTETIPPTIIQAFNDNAIFIAHNAEFDKTCLVTVDSRFDTVSWFCTMQLAQMHGLPGGLGALSKLLNLEEQKSDGKKLVLKFCKPAGESRLETRYTKENSPEDWEKYKEYCAQDVLAMASLLSALPKNNLYCEFETQVRALSNTINQRGFAVDLELAEAAVEAAAQVMEGLYAAAEEDTNGTVSSYSKRNATLDYIRNTLGFDMPDLKAGTLKQLLAKSELPAEVKAVLSGRLQTAKISIVKKYSTLLDAVSKDGRLRGTLNYCGAARTGRWSGRVFQPQNLPRPNFDDNDFIEQQIYNLKKGRPIAHDKPMDVLSSMIRGTIVPALFKKFIVCDLSGIENRVLPWLAGEDWKIKAYENIDAHGGPDMYQIVYAKSFNISDPSTVSGKQREIGKFQELALGYGGALGAFTAITKTKNVVFDEATILELVRAWRQANANIVNFWYTLEDAVFRSFSCKRVTLPQYQNIIVNMQNAKTLTIALPSGRVLMYYNPKLDDKGFSYVGLNGYTRKVERIYSYGGKLVENITQAVARDVFAQGVLEVEKIEGHETVLTVHDEGIYETPLDATCDKVVAAMTKSIPWAQGLPLAAKAFETTRYRK